MLVGRRGVCDWMGNVEGAVGVSGQVLFLVLGSVPLTAIHDTMHFLCMAFHICGGFFLLESEGI